MWLDESRLIFPGLGIQEKVRLYKYINNSGTWSENCRLNILLRQSLTCWKYGMIITYVENNSDISICVLQYFVHLFEFITLQG